MCNERCPYCSMARSFLEKSFQLQLQDAHKEKIRDLEGGEKRNKGRPRSKLWLYLLWHLLLLLQLCWATEQCLAVCVCTDIR